MNRLMLITEHHDLPFHPAGALTEGLAHALASLGPRIDVITRHAGAPRPGHEVVGRITIHRVPLRPDATSAAFAAHAAQRFCELAALSPPVAALCIDTPHAALILRTLRATSAATPPTPILGVAVDPERWQHQQSPFLPCDQLICLSRTMRDHFATILHTHQHTDPTNADASPLALLPAPANASRWRRPLDTTNPLFLLTGRADQRTFARISAAFAASALADEGWLLAAPAAEGRWLTTPARTPSARALNVLIVPGDRDSPTPAEHPAALHALAAGVLPLIATNSTLAERLPTAARPALLFNDDDPDALTHAMRRVAALPASAVTELISAVREPLLAEAAPHTAARAWQMHLDTLPRRDTGTTLPRATIVRTLDTWRALAAAAPTARAHA